MKKIAVDTRATRWSRSASQLIVPYANGPTTIEPFTASPHSANTSASRCGGHR